MPQSKLAGTYLTVVIRNDAPMVFCGDSPSYRTVRVNLTDEQIQSIRLWWSGKQGTEDFFEEVSRCILE